MKKRSILSLLTACVLMMAFATPLLVSASSMERSVCSHPTTRSTQASDYWTLDENEHQRRTITRVYCTVCNTLLSITEGPFYTEPHSMNLSYTDSYHTGRHHVWVYKCICGHKRNTFVACSGPPCSSPMSLDDLEPCTHTDVTTDIAQKQVTDTTVQSVFTRICDDCDAVLSVSTGIPREKRP